MAPLFSHQRTKHIRELSNQFFCEKVVLSDAELKFKNECKNSFYIFVKASWPHIDPDQFFDNWHIKSVCDHLQAVYTGDIRKLILNLPPRTGKTNIVYVLFPVWVWLQDPTASFLSAAYSDDLATTQCKRCYEFIISDWFKHLWGQDLVLGRSKKESELDTLQKGKYLARSIQGGVLGHGARFRLIDDPNNKVTLFSATMRRRENNNVINIVGSRTRGVKAATIVTQQRLDPDDCTAHLLRNNNMMKWVHLFIPEHFDQENICRTIKLPGHPEVWRDPRRKQGELLDPKWRTEEDFVAEAKAAYSHPAYMAEYEQRPLLPEGNIINPDWFKLWKFNNYPYIEYILQSWDTALTDEQDSAYSACTTWGMYQKPDLSWHILLMDVYSERLKFPALREKAIELFQEFDADEIMIEQKVSGYSLKQELESYGLPVTKFNPTRHGSKELRCQSISGFIEAGYVWLPCYFDEEHEEWVPEPFAEKLMNTAQYFPNLGIYEDTLDIIDSMSQAMITLAGRYLLKNKPIKLNDRREYNVG
jgi:phage terminase large subunit-like protein